MGLGWVIGSIAGVGVKGLGVSSSVGLGVGSFDDSSSSSFGGEGRWWVTASAYENTCEAGSEASSFEGDGSWVEGGAGETARSPTASTDLSVSSDDCSAGSDSGSDVDSLPACPLSRAEGLRMEARDYRGQ